MPTVDRDLAIKSHARSIKALMDYIDGHEPEPPSVLLDAQGCDLGRWLDGDGARFASLTEYTKLRTLHAQYHQDLSEITALVKAGDSVSALARLKHGSEFAELTRGLMLAFDELCERIDKELGEGRSMGPNKRIALIAHDRKKRELLDWVLDNLATLRAHRFWATGTTGKLIQEHCPELALTRLKSGPLGGDQQVGAMIAEGEIDVLIFFIDSMTPQPHDVDVKALIRLSTLYNIPMANNRATADFLITSPLFASAYQPVQDDLASSIPRRAEAPPS